MMYLIENLLYTVFMYASKLLSKLLKLIPIFVKLIKINKNYTNIGFIEGKTLKSFHVYM